MLQDDTIVAIRGTRARHCSDHPDHIEDPSHGPLVERVHLDPVANEIAGDARLEIGERQDEIGLQREDLVDVRRREGAHARLLAASLRRAHDVAGDANYAVLLAEYRSRSDLPGRD
jgi:hypothetical protein